MNHPKLCLALDDGVLMRMWISLSGDVAEDWNTIHQIVIPTFFFFLVHVHLLSAQHITPS